MATSGSSLYDLSSEINKAVKSYYRFKIFKSKAAVVVLLWIFCGLFAISFLEITKNGKNDGKKNPLMVITVCMLVTPLLGWLADVKCGRYVVVKWGLRIIWVTSILFCIINVVHFEKSAVRAVVIYVPLSLGLCGLVANILQLGIDQLADASSDEITSFIRWCMWLWFLSGISVAVSKLCFLPEYKVLGFLPLPAVITVGIVADCFFNHWLTKEPVSDNPLVLIMRVLQYAMKNKYPRLRSAFADWDNKRNSRVDLAKSEFGGPFTRGQVEDVKTFFRILSIILIAALFLSLSVSVYPMYGNLMSHLECGNADNHNLAQCFKVVAVSYSGRIFMVITIPIFEFFFYPFFKQCVQVSISGRITFGMVFFVLSLAACTAIEFLGNNRLPHVNATCPLSTNLSSIIIMPIDCKWMMFPYIMNSIGQFLFVSSSIEFLCAQSPYSMKGLLFGITYGSIGFFMIPGFSLSMFGKFIAKRWLTNRYGCMSWYMLIALVFLFAVLIIFFLASKCYKKRLRDDNGHNEHMISAVNVNYHSVS